MIFKIVNTANIEKLVIANIINHVNLDEFLMEKAESKDMLICPSNAIDIVKKEINKNCIDCALCWIKNKSQVLKTDISPDYESFELFLTKNKKFIYIWLSLSISNFSGVNIKTTGYSRIKRIPLIVKENKTLYIFKSVKEYADIEKSTYELDDIISLFKESKEYIINKVVLVIKDFTDSNIPNDTIVLKLKSVFNTIVKNEENNIKNIIKQNELFNK